jgi:hypothetical protein
MLIGKSVIAGLYGAIAGGLLAASLDFVRLELKFHSMMTTMDDGGILAASVSSTVPIGILVGFVAGVAWTLFKR